MVFVVMVIVVKATVISTQVNLDVATEQHTTQQYEPTLTGTKRSQLSLLGQQLITTLHSSTCASKHFSTNVIHRKKVSDF